MLKYLYSIPICLLLFFSCKSTKNIVKQVTHNDSMSVAIAEPSYKNTVTYKKMANSYARALMDSIEKNKIVESPYIIYIKPDSIPKILREELPDLYFFGAGDINFRYELMTIRQCPDDELLRLNGPGSPTISLSTLNEIDLFPSKYIKSLSVEKKVKAMLAMAHPYNPITVDSIMPIKEEMNGIKYTYKVLLHYNAENFRKSIKESILPTIIRQELWVAINSDNTFCSIALKDDKGSIGRYISCSSQY